LGEGMELALQQAIDTHPVITFDVYDTLVCRVIYKDRDLWQLVDREYQKRNHAKPIGFYKKRETADHKARKTYPYREVTLDEIYEVFADLYGQELADACKALEIELEINLTFPNDEVIEAYQYALKQNKKVYIISDMYLTDTIIGQVLEHNKITGYDKLFVSCIYRKTKHEGGALFSAVLEEIQAEAKNVLHIGNDAKADIQQSKAVGLDAYLIKPPSRKSYVNESKVKSDLDYSLLYGFIKKHNSPQTPDSLAYRLGFDVFGPIVKGFMEWIKVHKDNYNLDAILFLARDGYVLQEISDQEGKLTSFYSYLSRRSVVIPMIQYRQSLEDILRLYKSWQSNIKLNTLFNRLGIPYDAEVVRSVGLSESSTFTRDELPQDERIQALYSQVRARVYYNSQEQGQLLSDYLKQYKDYGRIGIVDLGAGTIVSALQQYSTIKNYNIDWIPLYLQNSLEPTDSYINISQNYELQTALRLGYMFLEVFFTAPHGTTLGYEYNEKCEAIPLLEDYEYSSIPEEYKNRLAELHQGAMDFYQSYPLDMMQYGSIDANLVMTNFIQFVLHPDDEDVAYWGPYPVYIDSFEPMVKNKSLVAYLSNPKQLVTDFKDSIWPAGFLHALGNSNLLLGMLNHSNQLRLSLKDKLVKR
jgi:hypothetical protein